MMSHFQPPPSPHPRVQEVKLYKAGWGGYAHQRFQRDLQHRLKAGWRLVSCQETGRDLFRRAVLTAVYEK